MDGVGDINVIGNVGAVPDQITEGDTPPPQLTTHDSVSDQITTGTSSPSELTTEDSVTSHINTDDGTDDVGIGLDDADLPVGHVIDSSSLPVDGPVTIPTSISAGDETEVIGMLLQTHGQEQDLGEDITSQQLNAAVSLHQSTMVTDTGQTVQAVTLADGTTAFIQHPKGGKFLEGQTITLEDGSTAVVQGITQVTSLPGSVSLQNNTIMSHDSHMTTDTQHVDGQPVQLEDGTTAFLHHTPKEGLQAIQLEDGTTAYITHPTPENLFGDAANCSLESTSLSLEQLTGQIASEVKTDNGVELVKSLSANPTAITVIAAGIGPEKAFSIGEKAYKCGFEGCGRLYTTHHHLKVHERSHTGDRPFKCDFLACNKAFATGYGLKSHTRVHTGEKPYKCPEEGCDKAFKTSGDLQKHVRTHTGERPFKCPFEGCDRSFTTSNIRKVHIRTHTGERPYICSEEGCGRAFASATNYKNHIRIHTGEKPYVCTVHGCGKRFTEYSSLYKHHVVHTHSKPYVCRYCGKTYRQTSTLAMHKRTAHGDDSPQDAEPQFYPEQAEGEEGEEPPEKRAKFQYALTSATNYQDGDNNTLVINTSDGQQVTMVSDGTMGTDEQAVSAISPPNQLTQITLEQLQQQHGVATLTVGDSGQQVYVITDPAQLESLQQLAQQQQQLENTDTIDASSLINTEDTTACDTNLNNNVTSIITTGVDGEAVIFNPE